MLDALDDLLGGSGPPGYFSDHCSRRDVAGERLEVGELGNSALMFSRPATHALNSWAVLRLGGLVLAV
jgi:hypothetical protein